MFLQCSTLTTNGPCWYCNLCSIIPTCAVNLITFKDESVLKESNVYISKEV